MGIIPADDPTIHEGTIPAWSYSVLKDFATCPYRIFLSKIKKIRVKQNEAMLRGIEIHQICEQYLKGIVLELPESLQPWESLLDEMREGVSEGNVFPECELAFDKEWTRCAWFGDTCWFRAKADVIIKEDETSYQIIDWKTGRQHGNEFAHSQQLQYYAVALGMAYPDAEFIKGTIYYLDQKVGAKLEKTYDRETIAMFLPKVTQRGLAITEKTEWHATPSDSACRWCNYKDTGDCQYAINL